MRKFLWSHFENLTEWFSNNRGPDESVCLSLTGWIIFSGSIATRSNEKLTNFPLENWKTKLITREHPKMGRWCFNWNSGKNLNILMNLLSQHALHIPQCLICVQLFEIQYRLSRVAFDWDAMRCSKANLNWEGFQLPSANFLHLFC